MEKNKKVSRKSKHGIWDRNSDVKAKHNDRDVESGLYYNEHKDEWVKRASRKEMKSKSDIKIYDFSVFSLEEIRRIFGEEKVERVGVFLSLVYERSFIEGYNEVEWRGVYFSTDEIKMFLGSDWNKVVTKLFNIGVLDVNKRSSRFRGDRKLRYFKLGELFTDDLATEFSRVEIKDARFEKSLLNHFKKSNAERIGLLKKIELTLDQCNLSIDDLDTLINSLFKQRLEKDLIDMGSDFVSNNDKASILSKTSDIEAFEKEYTCDLKRLYNSLVGIIQKTIIEEKRALYRISKDDFGGRLYHLFSNVPKEFRRHITIAGENVVEVDINASQPSFLCLLFEKGSSLKTTKGVFGKYKNEVYLNIAKQYKMDVYKYMAGMLKGKEFENDPETRVVMKKIFFQLVFGIPKSKLGVHSRKKICDKLFGEEFYNFLSELSEIDLGVGLNANYKNLAYLLQKTESIFMNFVMVELGEIPFLPIHDSVVVRESDTKVVKEVFKRMIIEHKLDGILTIK